MLGEADILLSPTVPKPAPRVGVFNHRDPQEAFAEAAEIGAFTVIFNVIHAPAASLPLGLTSSGLPIGVQIGAKAGRDLDILALSRQLERALPWRGRQNRFQTLQID